MSQRRLVLITCAAATLAILTPRPAVASGPAPLLVYNVVTYGADPTGGTDSTAAVNAAISAADSAAQPGGNIYFPPGTFVIGSSISANMHGLNIIGAGVNSTNIEVSGTIIVSTGTIQPPAHAGAIRDFTVTCNGGATGIITQDAIGLKWTNVAIQNCPTGIDMQNVSAWTERNDLDNVTFYDCGVAIHFDQQKGDANNSYSYNSFRIWVNTYASGTIFLLSGGGAASGSTYSVQGNIAYGTTIFDAHTASTDPTPNSMYNDTFFVKIEDNAVGSGTSYIFDDHNGGGGTGEIHGLGQFQYGSKTQWSAPNSVAIAVGNILNTPTDLGPITIGGGASDTYSNIFITPNSHCFVQPNNSTAASTTGVWISSVNWGQAVLSHSTGHSGAVFEVWCHP